MRIVAIVAIVAALMLPSCCWFCKRRVAPPIEVVEVKKECLPSKGPPTGIDGIKQATENCPKDHACYDPPNAVRLGRWILEAAEWMRDSMTLCGVKKEKETDEEPDP